MTLKLRVLHGTLKHQDGATAGMEVVVPHKRFVIGSATDCQMRCPSRTISPHHCEIFPHEQTYVIRDLKSESGTLVNGVRIDQDVTLENGDQLKVGRLEFQVALEVRAVAPKISPATPPPPAAPADSVGDSISDMLVAADQADRAQRRDDPAKRKFEVAAQEQAKPSPDADPAAHKKLVRPPKRPPIKLPPPPKIVAEDTVHAAEEVLKKYFEKPKK